jgi:uncharacterized iron-regulated protein
MVSSVEAEMDVRRSLLAVLSCLGVTVPVGAEELDLLPIGDAARATDLASSPVGTFYDCREDRQLSLDELAAALVEARVVLIGEDHTNLDQKLFHADLLEAMAAHKQDLILGMEFFLRSQGELLSRWQAQEMDDEQFIREAGWYDRGSYRWEYYRPVMDVARSHGIPVVGLNVPREIPRTVNRSGLEGLSEEQRHEVGEIDTSGSPEHRYLISRYFGETVAMLPPGWFDNMYAAQCLWDVVMARSILEDLGPDATLVVIVGSGHVAYDVGIGRRIHEELAATGRPDMRVATFCPVLAPPPDPEGDPHGHPMGGHGGGMGDTPKKPARFVRSLADYVGVFADTGGLEAYPRLGLQLDEGEDGGPVVSMVWPDTPAEAVGFAHGDRVVEFNGTAPGSPSDLRTSLAQTEWGQRADFTVERNGEPHQIGLLLFPTVDLSETVVAPGYTIEEALPPDPTSAAPVVVDDGAGMRRRHLLVSEDDGAERVEVWSDDVLEEVHELDAARRVVRSLYRSPRADGAVEVRYERAEGGSVASVVRMDSEGQVIRG